MSADPEIDEAKPLGHSSDMYYYYLPYTNYEPTSQITTPTSLFFSSATSINTTRSGQDLITKNDATQVTPKTYSSS